MGYAKLKISADIFVATGLHIGGSSAFAAIGATDSPVVKDPVTNLPIIPGSSIKGKMRHLLAKSAYNNSNKTRKIADDSPIISRNFGNAKVEEYKLGRLIFRDAFLVNKEELDARGVRSYTEVKFENTIDRISALANPRQIERVVRESRFGLEIIYDIVGQSQAEILEDIEMLADGLQLLELDYLGGSGSRGYGKVAFEGLTIELAYGEYDISPLRELIQKEG